LLTKKIIPGIMTGLFMALCIVACRQDPDTRIDPRSLQFNVPQGWPAPFYNFSGNPLTKDGFELGRKIFYDPRLSRDNSISCGSCHQSFAAFAHQDHNLSHGVEDRLGVRNSPGLTNLAWSTSFFWDGGVNHIEVQPASPIQNPVEMDLRLDSAVARLNKDADYRERFNKVFGNPEVTSFGMFKALAQFMGMMVSADAKYDHFMRGEIPALSASETAGLKVYEDNCATCHSTPLFTDFSFRNNGLPVGPAKDSGRATITRSPADMQKFKVPSLRNLGYSAPYMHDGRFRNLNQVLDHYEKGIVASPTLDPLLQNGIKLSAQQRTDLLAFLGTLNDSTFVRDKRFEEVR